MIQHTKMEFKKGLLSVFFITLFFVNCKGNTELPITDSKKTTTSVNKVSYDKEIVKKETVVAKQWVFVKSVPIATSDATSKPSCNDKKYAELVIRIQNDSVFLFGDYTDKVTSGEVKSKDFFKEKYLFDFYKKMLKNEMKINLGETIKYARNTRAYSKDSKLEAYFRDAFFIEENMFIESNGCVYIYQKNGDVIDKNQKPKTHINKTVQLPLDFTDYYRSCIYPSDKNCKNKYPFAEFKDNNFLKIIETAIKIPEPSIFMSLPSPFSDIEVYLVAYQGNDNDSYHLVTLKKDQVISALQIGSMDGAVLNDFLIDKNSSVNLYTRKDADAKRKLIGSYEIATSGKIEIKK